MMIQISFLLLIGIISSIVGRVLQKYRQSQADAVIGQLKGCRPPPRVANQRLFGLDRIGELFRADRESRLMELLHFHIRQTGNTLEHVFLGIRAFGTVEPANLEAILSTKFKDYGNGPRRDITLPLFGNGIFTQEGDAWWHSREAIRQQLMYKQYENLEPLEVAIGNLIHIVQNSVGVVDLQPLFFKMTLDIATTFFFGESVESLQSSDSAGEVAFADAFDTAQSYIIRRYRLLDFYWFIDGRQFRKACDEVHRFADQIIDRNLVQVSRTKDNLAKSVFLSGIGQGVSDRNALRDQIINLTAATRDTTASLLSWTFFLLVRHPRVLKKLREEILYHGSVGLRNKLCRNSLRELKYLQNVLKETLRLYPSVPVNTRTAVKTTVLPTGGGTDGCSPVLIPKGSTVAYSVYSMHRRVDLYGKDAELFRPERWDEDMPKNLNKTNAQWGYLPFNGGPRACIGKDFALTEAAFTVVRILQQFPTIKLPRGELMERTGGEKQKMTLVISIVRGCNITIRE